MTVSQRTKGNKMKNKPNHKQNQGAVIVGSSAVLGHDAIRKIIDALPIIDRSKLKCDSSWYGQKPCQSN
jgi:hypothetical protein